MYYRRKILLSLLQKSKNLALEKLTFQKLLLLFCKTQKKMAFDFIPYKYGGFSFQSNKDLLVLESYYKLLENRENKWYLKSEEDYFNQLEKNDQKGILETLNNVYYKNQSDIINYTYNKYPYYIINSQRKLTKEQLRLKNIECKKLTNNQKSMIFSLGYEGISIDTYLNKLIKNNVRLLCDIRRNPISMKYGFSKKQLKSYCEELDIKYIHIPELGIESIKRKNLDNQKDYEKLFLDYKKNLQKKESYVKEIINLYKKYTRIALTCFEKDYISCHRNTLINYFNKKDTFHINHL